MISIKTNEEIEMMRQGGRILSGALKYLLEEVSIGAKMVDLDQRAETYLLKHGAKPSFKGFCIPGLKQTFPSTVCISLNHEVVHGFGNRSIVLQEGDIVGFDLGCWYRGLCTDMAITVCIGQVDKAIKDFVEATKQALFLGVAQAQSGKHLLDISIAIESAIKSHGYGIVRDLAGHGVGYAVHEDPPIPNFVDSSLSNPLLSPGMCLALEPMTTMGHFAVVSDKTGWIVSTKDKSLSAHFEVTLVVTDTNPEILTPLPF